MKKLHTITFLVLIALNQLFADNIYVRNPQTWHRGSAYIKEAEIAIIPKGVFLEYNIYLTIGGTNYRDITQYVANEQGEYTPITISVAPTDSMEIYGNFTLPNGSIVTDAWLWVDKDIVQAKIMDRSTATEIYNEIVGMRKDPLILRQSGSNYYYFNIYPMLPDETRKIKITYLVPATFSGNVVQAELPHQLFASSYNKIDNLKVYIKPQEGWENPRILEATDLQFGTLTNSDENGLLGVKIPSDKSQNQLTIAFDAPMKNDVFFNTYNDGKETYYQLAFNPEKVFVESTPTNYIFVINADTNYAYINTNKLTKKDLLEQIKTFMLSKMDKDDSFNVVIQEKTGSVIASKAWIKASPENAEQTINSLIEKNSETSNNLIESISLANKFVNEHEHGEIILISNLQCNKTDTLAQMIEEITKSGTLNKINVIDFSHLYQSYYYQKFDLDIFVPWGSNNNLLRELANKTGGMYAGIYYTNAIAASIAYMDREQTGKLKFFEVSTKAEGGLAYAKLQVNGSSFSRYTNEPIVEYGKLKGGETFTVLLSGEYNGKLLTKEINFPLDLSEQTDSTLKTAWVGKYILQMAEQGYRSEIDKKEAIKLSVENRILSSQTAFLALEPSDTIATCTNCTEEWAGGEITTSIKTGLPNDMAVTTDMAFEIMPEVTVVERIVEKEVIINVTEEEKEILFEQAYNKGIEEAEKNCMFNYEDAFNEGYQKGLLNTENKTGDTNEDIFIEIYPNPFSTKITISCNLNEIDRIESIKIFDTTGRLIKTINLKEITNGQWTWDGTTDEGQSVNAGIYTIEIKTTENTHTQKIIKM